MSLFSLYVYFLTLALIISATASISGTIGDNLASYCGEDDAFHEKYAKCYPLRTECCRQMRFYDSGGGYGDCDCDDSFGMNLIGFWRPHNQCYHLYTQGPCQQNQWIVVDRETNSTKCELNPCPSLPEIDKWDQETDFWFYRFGKCWKTNTRAFCAKNEIFRIYYDVSGRDKADFGECLHSANGRDSFTRQPWVYLPCKPGYIHTPDHPKCKRIQLDFKRNDSPDD